MQSKLVKETFVIEPVGIKIARRVLLITGSADTEQVLGAGGCIIYLLRGSAL